MRVHGETDGMKPLDVIIDTRPVNAPITNALKLLAIEGRVVRVGISPKEDQDLTAQWIPLNFQEHPICESIVIGPKRLNELMELAGSNVDFIEKGEERWGTETLPFDQINDELG